MWLIGRYKHKYFPTLHHWTAHALLYYALRPKYFIELLGSLGSSIIPGERRDFAAQYPVIWFNF